MTGLVTKHTVPNFLRKFVRSAVQNVTRGLVWVMVKYLTFEKDPTIFQRCAVQGNNQPTLWKFGQRLMKLKKMGPIVLLYNGDFNDIKNGTIEKIQLCG